MTFGIRLHVIVRETEEEAWTAADELIERVDEDTIAAAQKTFPRIESVGQSRMAGSWRPTGQAGGRTEPVGRCRSRPRRRRNRAGRRSRSRWLNASRIPDSASKLHLLRLSASRRGLSLRRARLPAAAGTLCQPRRTRHHQPHRPVRRNDCQRCPTGQGLIGRERRQLRWPLLLIKRETP